MRLREAVFSPQVCLAAEECGHLDFDTRQDTWWNGDAFHCGGAPGADVHFYDIFLKVGARACHSSAFALLPLCPLLVAGVVK